MQAEERSVGRVQRSVYLSYLKAWSSVFYWVPIAVLLMAFAERGLQVKLGQFAFLMYHVVSSLSKVRRSIMLTDWSELCSKQLVQRGRNSSGHQ